MAKVDEKDIQSFNELQKTIISIAEQQKIAQQQESSATQSLRRAILTATELEKLPDSTTMYAAVGKAFFLVPRRVVLTELETDAKGQSTELKKLKDAKQTLASNMQAAENDLRELLENCHGLAQAFAAS